MRYEDENIYYFEDDGPLYIGSPTINEHIKKYMRIVDWKRPQLFGIQMIQTEGSRGHTRYNTIAFK